MPTWEAGERQAGETHRPALKPLDHGLVQVPAGHRSAPPWPAPAARPGPRERPPRPAPGATPADARSAIESRVAPGATVARPAAPANARAALPAPPTAPLPGARTPRPSERAPFAGAPWPAERRPDGRTEETWTESAVPPRARGAAVVHHHAVQHQRPGCGEPEVGRSFLHPQPQDPVCRQHRPHQGQPRRRREATHAPAPSPNAQSRPPAAAAQGDDPRSPAAARPALRSAHPPRPPRRRRTVPPHLPQQPIRPWRFRRPPSSGGFPAKGSIRIMCPWAEAGTRAAAILARGCSRWRLSAVRSVADPARTGPGGRTGGCGRRRFPHRSGDRADSGKSVLETMADLGFEPARKEARVPFELSAMDGTTRTAGRLRGQLRAAQLLGDLVRAVPDRDAGSGAAAPGGSPAAASGVVGVDIGEEIGDVRRFVEETGITFEIVIDQDLANRAGVRRAIAADDLHTRSGGDDRRAGDRRARLGLRTDARHVRRPGRGRLMPGQVP